VIGRVTAVLVIGIIDSSVVDVNEPLVLFTNTQVRELEIYYSNNKYLPIEERHLLVKRLKLSQHQIKWWFQNRRMKEKRQLKNMNKFGEIDMTQFVTI
jgi:hypothetical protein